MAGNTYADTGQRTEAVAMPSTKGPSGAGMRSLPVTRAPAARPARQRRFGVVGRRAMGVVNAALA